MITGYNTDVRHNDVVFHVQTEDKGLSNPFIESLVYVGGQVLASRRSNYADLLSEGKEEKDIVAMMDHQHRTMIAAIRHGKLDSKLQALLAGKQTSAFEATRTAAATAGNTAANMAANTAANTDGDTGTIARPAPPPPSPTPPERPLPPPGSAPASAPARERTLDQVILEYLTNEADQEQLVLLVEEEAELALGKQARLVVRTSSSKSGMPVVGAQVSVRMISTVADPRVLGSGLTDDDGLAVLAFDIPAIGRGTAALIITAVSAIGRAERKKLL